LVKDLANDRLDYSTTLSATAAGESLLLLLRLEASNKLNNSKNFANRQAWLFGISISRTNAPELFAGCL
jgi:hypothetical protein